MKLTLDHVTYRYANAATSRDALRDISLTFTDHAFAGVIGATGSGKSTLGKLLNGLYKPTAGTVLADGDDIHGKDFDLRTLRTKVGLVFQYPEHQLFEETVLKDVCFGPLNMGRSVTEAEEDAKEALRLTGVDEALCDRPPYLLSGGEMRRVAIAGVLAMRPEILVLDEPTAGLDPAGAAELMALLTTLRRERGIGIIMISHNMEEVASVTERIVVLHEGKVALDGAPSEVFAKGQELRQIGLNIPQVSAVLQMLRERGLTIDTSPVRIEDAVEAILRAE